MPIQVTAPQIQPQMQAYKQSQTFGHNKTYSHHPEWNEPSPSITKAEKAFILLSSALGTLAALALIGKKQKLNIFKWSELKNIEIEAKEIIQLGTGSVLGGLISGILSDKENSKGKFRESLQQYVGNIIFPIGFVAAATSIYKKCTKNVKFPKFKGNTKSIKALNGIIKSLPVAVVTLGALAAGIITGNKVTNAMNNKLFKKHEKRNIKISDMAAHVDDMCLGATIVANNISTAENAAHSLSASAAGNSVISKLIPPALVIPGYMTGTAKSEA